MGKTGTKKNKGALGNALNNSIGKKAQEKQKYIAKHGAEFIPTDKPKLTSVVERSTLDDFLYNAEIAQEKFEAVKGPKIILKDNMDNIVVHTMNESKHSKISDEEKAEILNDMKYSRIPRRPKWDGV